jgi:hypothetical protein
MTLSLALLILIPLFLIPTFLLPRNKLWLYSFCAGVPFILFIAVSIFDKFTPSFSIMEKIGKGFLGMFSFLTERETISMESRLRITFFLACIFLYLVIYLILYISSRFWFIGKNPSIHKRYTTPEKILLAMFFFISTYGFFAIILIGIRQIIPLSDGFLKWMFDIICPLGE